VRRASTLVLAVALLALAGCHGGDQGASGPTPSPGTTSRSAHIATLPLGSTTRSGLDIESGVTTLEITAASLSGQLLTAVTPGRAGVQPSLTTDDGGIVHLTLPHASGGGGHNTVVVVLNRAVTWSLFLDGGASVVRLNLDDAKVGVVAIQAGVSAAHVTLPRPDGTELLRLTAGAGRLDVSVPHGVPTKLHLKGGASSVRIGHARHTGIGPPVSFFLSGRYAAARNRIDIEVESGVSAVSVEPYLRAVPVASG
jgi:hypothetical protein